MFSGKHVKIPDELWEEIGLETRPDARLLSDLSVNGTSLHLEAFLVPDPDAELQEVHEDWQEVFELLAQATTPDGHFETTRIRGLDYVIFASPYC